MTRHAPAGRRDARAGGWPVPVALLALSAIPVTVGTARLAQLAGLPTVLPGDPRFADTPVALMVHTVGATVYALLGAFQLAASFRRRHPAWHRQAGRVVTVAGLAVSGSALWLTLFYPPQPGTGSLLYFLRLVFASAMAASLVLGITAIRRRDIAAHRAWMIRGYAIALAAGTQAFTEGIGGVLFGSGETAGDIAKALGWVINLAVAELAIHRQPRGSWPRPVSASTRQPSVGGVS